MAFISCPIKSSIFAYTEYSAVARLGAYERFSFTLSWSMYRRLPATSRRMLASMRIKPRDVGPALAADLSKTAADKDFAVWLDDESRNRSARRTTARTRIE